MWTLADVHIQTMLISEIHAAVADFESRFADAPVRIEAGSKVWYSIERYFYPGRMIKASMAGLPIALNLAMPLNAYDVYLTNGCCRRYYIS